MAKAISPRIQELQALSEQLGPTEWRQVSDVAQVVANYLRCHPCVERVRYPGLKTDALFREASTTLVGGFGPIVEYRVAGEWHHLVCDSVDAKQLVLELERELAPLVLSGL